MDLVPSGSNYLVPKSGGSMGGFWNSLNNHLVNKAIEYGKKQQGFQSNAKTIGGQVYDAIMYYGKNGVPALPSSQSNSGLLTYPKQGQITYPQPAIYPQIDWVKNNRAPRVYRIKQLGGSTTPNVAWGPGLYADFVGGGLADPFFLQ